MTPVNPVVVRGPDGLIGCLVGRSGTVGYVDIDRRRVSWPLIALEWHLTPCKGIVKPVTK